MFEVYTIEARRTIFVARDEADKSGSPFIETEHILLGIAVTDPDLLADLLSLKDPATTIRDQIVLRSPYFGGVSRAMDLPLSNEAKRVLAYAAEEAQRLGNNQIDTRHLLLGVLRETESLGARILLERGAEIDAIRVKLATSPPHESPLPDSVGFFSPAGYADRVKRPLESSIREPSQDVNRGTRSESSLFRHYTEKSLRCIFYARYFVSEFGGDRIEPQHLLLAIVRETHPKFLDFEEIRAEIERSVVTAAKIPTSVDVPLAEATKRALQLAGDEARELGSNSIVPEHLLLGIMREENNLAANLLKHRGVNSELVRRNLKENNDWSAPPT